jgi:hypothetical protein
MNVYSLSVRYLLNNPTDINRALKAFEIAIHSSTSEVAQFEDPTTTESCFKWLKLAKKLYDKTDHNELSKFQPFPSKYLNCKDKIDWIQHSFVLSFYYLLRFKDFKSNSEINFYQYCIKQTIW